MATVNEPASAGSSNPDNSALRDILPDAPDHRWPVHIGVDVGQVRDPSAYCVMEVVQRALGLDRWRPIDQYDIGLVDPRRVRWWQGRYVFLEVETVYICHDLKRIDIGTRYPEMAEIIANKVCSPFLAGRSRTVYIDMTGVGRPISELISDAILARKDRGNVEIRPITFTSGREFNPATGMMGKAFLASRLQALSQANPARLIFPANHPEAEAMRKELKDYALRVDQNAHDTYGAMRAGQWDDLATAAGLSTLEDPLDAEPGYIPFHAPGFYQP